MRNPRAAMLVWAVEGRRIRTSEETLGGEGSSALGVIRKPNESPASPLNR